jgi:ParB-like chromosome segregation protein Spo0J
MEWHTEKRKLSELIEWEKNPRQLSKHDSEHIKKSLEKFGVADPLVINTDNLIIGGHQRKKILRLINDPDYEVDVRVPDRLLTDEEVAELNIRLNKNSGAWDWDTLANEFEVLDLIEWGFSEEELTGEEFYDEKELKELDIDFIEEKPFWVVMRFDVSQIPDVMQKLNEIKELLPDIKVEMTDAG